MVDLSKLIEALQCGSSGCQCHRNGTGKHMLHCPSHEDRTPSLSVAAKDGKVLVHCHSGCEQQSVIDALKGRGLWGDMFPTVKTETVQHPPRGLTLLALSQAKKLTPEELQAFGVAECNRNGARVVRIAYTDQSGNLAAVRFRVGLSKDGPRFVWRSGDHAMLYGLDRLKEIQKAGWVLLVEGESDCWTLWHYGLPALGIPGKNTWRAEWAELTKSLDVYLWQEPDAADLTQRVSDSLPEVFVVAASGGIKDISEAHILGHDVPALVARLKTEAVPASVIRREQSNAKAVELAHRAETVLSADDPMKLAEQAIRTMGYGGDIRPAMITYLAATSRLTAIRPGSMLVHLLLLGTPSAGKSWTAKVVMRLLPSRAYHVIDAGSPRVLIYDQSDLTHRLVVFSEADSLPSGEDNPAASAVRNLLQDNELHYSVSVRDPETGDWRVQDIRKSGPTVMLTTAVRRLGEQLMTRLFTVELGDCEGQILAALETQAEMELNGAHEPDSALIAFQDYLQAKAPWDVHIPFVKELAKGIGKSGAAPRILRDFARLLSLIKSVAILRHKHRKLDARGRVIAQVEDYATVAQLVGDMYSDTVSGATKAIRETVEVVLQLSTEKPNESITLTKVSEKLKINKSSASRRVKAALAGGWLVNEETRKGFPAKLQSGEPLPSRTGLPDPNDLARCCSVPLLTDGYMEGKVLEREMIEL